MVDQWPDVTRGEVSFWQIWSQVSIENNGGAQFWSPKSEAQISDVHGMAIAVSTSVLSVLSVLSARREAQRSLAELLSTSGESETKANMLGPALRTKNLEEKPKNW